MSSTTTTKFTSSQRAPFDPAGFVTLMRTYARRKDESRIDSPIESWTDILNRVVTACNNQLNCGFTPSEQKELFNLLFALKGSVAGRFLWQLGTRTVDEKGIPSLQNCAFTVIDHPIRPFTWAMNMLMLGSGVGFRLLKSDIAKLPQVHRAVATRVDSKDADFIVPDSREGWVKLLSRVLKAHFYNTGGFTYSCLLLRSKGAPIRGFGGTASGPEILCDGMNKIQGILNARAGNCLRPIDALDIMNVIGMIVVAGNVRRSAQIALGDTQDTEYISAKNWSSGCIPNYRAYSNNSVICNDINDVIDNEDFWRGYTGESEPYGLVNLDLMRREGRLGDVEYTDPTVQGTNPCAEMSLASFETCCLAELFLPKITSYEECEKMATYLYRICKESLRLPCKDSRETEEIVHKNMRMGIGVTGYMQATEEQKKWLPRLYAHLRAYDETYSALKGYPTSVKLTTCKPSGTLSLVGGTTSGVHPGYARWYIRRIRFDSSSPLLNVLRSHGYPVEPVKLFDGTLDHNTSVVEFPYSLPAHTVFADDCTAVQQLETVKRLQTDWSDNSVSVTVTYKLEELPAIKEWLRKNYNNSVKSVSFLLYSGHGFAQAPIEPITEDVYNKMMSTCKPITEESLLLAGITAESEELLAQNECAGGACPMR